MKLRHLFLVLSFLLLSVVVARSADQTITFEWDVPAEEVTGYNIYSGDSASGPWTKINAELIAETTYAYTYTDAVEAGRWFYVTASDGRNESEPSNVVDCMIDTVPPGKVGTLTLSSD